MCFQSRAVVPLWAAVAAASLHQETSEPRGHKLSLETGARALLLCSAELSHESLGRSPHLSEPQFSLR